MRKFDFIEELSDSVLDARAAADAEVVALGGWEVVYYGGVNEHESADEVVKALEAEARRHGLDFDAFPVRAGERWWYGKPVDGWEIWEEGAERDSRRVVLTAPDGCGRAVIEAAAREALRSIAHAEGRGCGERECVACY